MNKIELNMLLKNAKLSEFASKDEEAKRLIEEKEDIRTKYYHDIDRVIYSLSYIRYMDKTQVFSNKKHDHLTKRMLHVHFVSKISRTIARALNLNEDLVEASALAHDLGHVPFGHEGEKILNKLSIKHNEGYFNHNAHSVRLLMNIENYGKGLNLSYQVLDAVLCHNGEVLKSIYEPVNKTPDMFLNDYYKTYENKSHKLNPGTLEACIVRVSDVIGYIARDLEDAYRLKLISKGDLPDSISSILGSDTSTIVHNIVMDIIKNSIDKNYIKMSDKIYNAINELKNFNYKNIYYNANTKEELENMDTMYEELFDSLLNDLNSNNEKALIKSSYLNNLNDEYKKNSNARIVIDYIAGMTDEYFIKSYKGIIKK